MDDSSSVDVKPSLSTLMCQPPNGTVADTESTAKRKRHPYHTPRKTKLRKLNAPTTNGCPPDNNNNHRSLITLSSSPSAASSGRGSNRITCSQITFKLLATIVLLSLCGSLASFLLLVPSARTDLLDALHLCRHHFELEYNAFVNNDPASNRLLADQLVPHTMRRLHTAVSHQPDALMQLERRLRQHCDASVASEGTSSTSFGGGGVGDPVISALALVGGSGTGKTLSVGLLMRQWLLSNPRANVMHFVWSPAERTLPEQEFYTAARDQLSRFDANLLVIDSIPQRSHRDVAHFHREFVAHVRHRQATNLLAVYVVNVPTFGPDDVLRRAESVAEASDSLVAGSDGTDGEVTIETIVFEPIAGAEQLRECIEREYRRLRPHSEPQALTEEQMELILAGIAVAQSGCKHVGARVAMYL